MPEDVKAWNFHFHINEACKKYSIDPMVIYALILTESNGDPYAYRYEPETIYYYVKWHTKYPKWPGIDDDSKKMLQKSSIGLCQVMGSTAIDMGFTDITTMMCIPKISIDIGVKYWYLQAERFKTTNPLKTYFAYNTGSFYESTFSLTKNVKAYSSNLEKMGYYNE